MSFLLDTNFVSEASRKRLWKGIELKRVVNPDDAGRLEVWLQRLSLGYRSRILALDEAAADRWGRIMASHPTVPVEDGQLAATALRHGLTLVTRNTRDVAPTGVPHFNPF